MTIGCKGQVKKILATAEGGIAVLLGLIFVIMLAWMTLSIDNAPKLIFTGMMIWVLAVDVTTMRIPNRLVLITILAFVLTAPLRPIGLEGTFDHIGTGVTLYAALFVVAVLGAMTGGLPLGGGDVKLGGAIGLWLGFGPAFFAFVAWSILLMLGLVAAVFALTLSRQIPGLVPLCGIKWVDELTNGNESWLKAKVPFGIPLTLAAIIAIWKI